MKRWARADGKINYPLIIGTLITGVCLGLVILGLFWSPYDPDKMDAAAKLAAPSAAHWFGGDNLGRDIFSRILEGMKSSLFIAAAIVFIGAVFGVIIGAFTGYFGGVLDEILMRVNDAVNAFPSVLLALIFISLFGSGKKNVIISLGILFIPSFSRITRTEYARCKSLDYVHSAKLMGASDLRIMFVHILPNVVRVLLSSMAIGFNNAILAESSLSFLGIGVRPPDASLGRMMSESQSYLFSAPWYALFTGGAIAFLILGFSLLNDGFGES